MPFFYTDVEDVTVKLVKGGVVSGNNLADTVTKWPSGDVEVQYGGVANMWGLALASTDVNASDFGVVLSAAVTSGTGRVDRIAVRVHYSLATNQDNPSYLAVMEVDDDRVTVTPRIYSLPRAGLTIAQDPNISRATDAGTLRTSRFYAPDRNILKTFTAWEFYATISPANCSGLTVWACVDDGTPFQLNDETGVAAVFREDGSHRAFFPASTEGRWCYIEYRVATPTGDQADTAVAVFDQRLMVSIVPRMRRRMLAGIQLGGGEFADAASMRRTVGQQRTDLEAIVGEVVPYRSPADDEGYARVVSIKYEEVFSTVSKKWSAIAQVQMEEVLYA